MEYVKNNEFLAYFRRPCWIFLDIQIEGIFKSSSINLVNTSESWYEKNINFHVVAYMR